MPTILPTNEAQLTSLNVHSHSSNYVLTDANATTYIAGATGNAYVLDPNTTGGYPYWYPPPQQPPANWLPMVYPSPPSPSVDEKTLATLRDLAKQMGVGQPTEKKESKSPMRGLFEVVIVDPETEEFVDIAGFKAWKVIARDEASAKLKAVTKATLAKDVDDYDIIVRRLGDVRAKKTVQEVKIAN